MPQSMKLSVELLAFIATLFYSCNQNKEPTCDVGLFFPDVMHGITYKYENDASFLFRIGFFDENGNYIIMIKYFNEHRYIEKDTAGQKYGGFLLHFS
jgi:hypothetical protein